MADDLPDKIFAAVLVVVLTAALGPWVADQLWQLQAVRTIFYAMVFAVVATIVIGGVLIFRRYSDGGGR